MMNPIPVWVRRLWDVWDLRVLVLLSFTLQLILSIFGNRRKYISSLFINVLVWSAYLTADWVATVALGKLSDVQSYPEKSNILLAIWAPLLLLHLGGPDSITAYSLEDNQLWLRHLLGLVVQLSVAIYVILMSWKSSWFSFMSLPALVAGIIKYGERTWVLKSVSDDNYRDTIPFGDLRDNYTTEGHEYVRVLILAHYHLQQFMIYLEREERYDGVTIFSGFNIEGNILWDSLEVQMGLMYDLLYTKATQVYCRRGCILRCISFGCTVTVSVGLIFRILLLKTKQEDDDHDHENWHEIDMAITGVLIVGALALEIYAAIVTFSSNWGMLWLIKQGRGEWVIWLSERFPCLFNKKKNWSKKMGQFDLLGYCLKVRETDVQSPGRKIIKSVLGRNYEDKWNRYAHKTTCSVHPLIYDAFLQNREPRSESLEPEVAELIWLLLEIGGVEGESKNENLWLYLATEVCYHSEVEWDGGGGDDLSGSDSSSSSWKHNREVCKALSNYMMYLLITDPSLLPNPGSRGYLENILHDPRVLIGDHAWEINAACQHILGTDKPKFWRTVVERLMGMEKQKRWEMIKLMWLRMLQMVTEDATRFGQKNCHFQHLRQGGELLTFIWFFYSTHDTHRFRHVLGSLPKIGGNV